VKRCREAPGDDTLLWNRSDQALEGHEKSDQGPAKGLGDGGGGAGGGGGGGGGDGGGGGYGFAGVDGAGVCAERGMLVVVLVVAVLVVVLLLVLRPGREKAEPRLRRQRRDRAKAYT
jgi:hypothetical protein